MTQTPPTVFTAEPQRDLGRAMRRGFVERCPHCGEGRMYRAYLKVNPRCPACGEDLSHQRADDAPPYITMLIVGHVIVGGVLAAEELFPQSPLWIDALIWLWLTLILSLALLPRVKGALVGYQWAMRMHGFGGHEDEM
ncbi:MAG TPA: DUF983 domain-containing protein [Roseiarcus sp.]|nr:DUF983 domain-containing protein [Roseiarcus sp.]